MKINILVNGKKYSEMAIQEGQDFMQAAADRIALAAIATGSLDVCWDYAE